MPNAFTCRAAILAALALYLCATLRAQTGGDFQQTLQVNPSEPVVLGIQFQRGDVRVVYSREGQVSITTSGTAPDGRKLTASDLASIVTLEQNGNRIHLRDVLNTEAPQAQSTIHYRIDVPYRTEVISHIEHGSQTFRGITGPIKADARNGDIAASYLSKGMQAQVESGNLNLEVIGEHVEARTRNGNITCARLPQGVTAETGDGDITLSVVGPSTATVTNGAGRIEVAGASSSFQGSTQAGSLSVKAEPHGDWRLTSASGTVRIELPPAFKASLDVSTDSGVLQIDRDDIPKPQPDARHFAQKLTGVGPRIDVHTGSGNILLR